MHTLNLTRALPALLATTLVACSGNATSTNLSSPTGPSTFSGARTSLTTLDTGATSPSCSVALQGTPESVSGGGATFMLSVVADKDCFWTAAGESGMRMSPNYGRGPIDIAVTVEPNPDRARTLSVDVNGRVAHFSQPNGCFYTIDRKSLTVSASGGRQVIMMTTLPGCLWFSSATERWIDVKEARAEGSGEVPFEFDANTGGERHAFVKIVNEMIPVTQAGVGN